MKKSERRNEAAQPKKKAVKKALRWLIGIDEVGRGPLAGPVAVCACVMPYLKSSKRTYGRFLKDNQVDIKAKNLVELWSREKGGIRDSKKLSQGQREAWHGHLKDAKTASFFYAAASAKDIDAYGISACISKLILKNLSAFLRSQGADADECLILLDGGLRAPAIFINQQTIIKGDQKELVISLASIRAKVTRDAHMRKLSKRQEYAAYGFEAHMGYGTARHRKAVQKFGPSNEHRATFLTRILAVD